MAKTSVPKWTPGPWVAVPPRLGAAITIYSGDVPIATTSSNTSPATMAMHRRGKVKANARLIAAAPDLYEAAEAAMQCIGELPPTQARVEVVQMLQAALSKATGSQQ